MTNKIHVEMLKTGVGFWNEWRENNPEIMVDLSGANLSEADLTNSNLVDTKLLNTDISRCNIYGIPVQEN
ncbi:MAG TPA: pentapeptide repeat-containing protein, partial [Desulfosporosinus sp.]|nr:pentapeptide repeat-containing protein [Desulfosporosinus sp.]